MTMHRRVAAQVVLAKKLEERPVSELVDRYYVELQRRARDLTWPGWEEFCDWVETQVNCNARTISQINGLLGYVGIDSTGIPADRANSLLTAALSRKFRNMLLRDGTVYFDRHTRL